MNTHETPRKGAMFSHQLTIISGTQQGATIKLLAQSRSTLGYELDNDIVLSSDTETDGRLELSSEREALYLTVLSGSVMCNDKPLDSVNRHFVSSEEVFSINQVQFVIHPLLSVSTPVLPSRRSVPPNGQQAMAMPFLRERSWQVACLATGLLLLMLAVSTKFVRATIEEPEPRTLQERLALSGFAHLNYSESQDGNAARLSGIVRNAEEKSRLLGLLAEQRSDLIINLQVNEDISSAIEDLYRVNGVKADVTMTGLGEVDIWTASRDEPLLSSIESSIREDFPAILSISATNVLPENDVVVAERNPPMSTSPDKEVTLVVAGAQGYIMTRDKSRYFVGSMLPSGHLIEKIEAGSVYVLLDGNLERLEF